MLKKKLGSTPKIRVSRVTRNKQFFCFGLTFGRFAYFLIQIVPIKFQVGEKLNS